MERRLFFGLDLTAPWPAQFPNGRAILEEFRHLTLVFLGSVTDEPLMGALNSFADLLPPISPVGYCHHLRFLPDAKHPRVAAFEVSWMTGEEELMGLQKALTDRLITLGYSLDKRPFYPHISVARDPHNYLEWKEHVHPLPFYSKALHLYESKGSSTYASLWSHPLSPPFVEVEHTADIAFKILGKEITSLHRHAEAALAFRDPHLLAFLSKESARSLDDIIAALNEMIARADAAAGCPFKAVSYHGKLYKTPQGLLEWEMIVDV